jgi:hypothetical protein
MRSHDAGATWSTLLDPSLSKVGRVPLQLHARCAHPALSATAMARQRDGSAWGTEPRRRHCVNCEFLPRLANPVSTLTEARLLIHRGLLHLPPFATRPRPAGCGGQQ